MKTTKAAILDTLKAEFPEIEISDHDKNGKHYDTTRWIFPKSGDRFGNVFIEVWERPRANRVDLVLYRYLMTVEENAAAPLDGNKRPGNTVRGMLSISDMTEQELLEFVRGKIERYIDMTPEFDEDDLDDDVAADIDIDLTADLVKTLMECYNISEEEAYKAIAEADSMR